MASDVEGKYQDQSFITLRIPYKYAHSLILDIDKLFEKDKEGDCPGARGITCDLRRELERIIKVKQGEDSLNKIEFQEETERPQFA